MSELSFHQVRQLCSSRLIDFGIATSEGAELTLKGGFDLMHFFSVRCSGVLYIDLCYGTIAEAAHFGNAQTAVGSTKRWSHLEIEVGGYEALLFSEWDPGPRSHEKHLVVAEEFQFLEGPDWFRVGGRI